LIASLTIVAQCQFLERIVTADEIWVRHYEPENKAKIMAWKRPTSSMAKIKKSTIIRKDYAFTFFLDMEGAILVHFTPKSETVTVITVVMCYENSKGRHLVVP
jgi:hypothetical protein